MRPTLSTIIGFGLALSHTSAQPPGHDTATIGDMTISMASTEVYFAITAR